MIYVLIIGFIVIAIIGSFASSRNIRKSHEANLEALKKAQDDADFSHRVSLRKASLFDEFKTSEKEPFNAMSDNQLLEFIEINIRQYNKSKDEILAAAGGFFGIFLIISAVGGWHFSSWYVLGVGAGIGAAICIFLAIKVDASLDHKYQQKGFTLDQLKIN